MVNKDVGESTTNGCEREHQSEKFRTQSFEV